MAVEAALELGEVAMSVLGEVEGVAGADDGGLEVATELQSEGVQRYGFHGLSLESIVRQLSSDLGIGAVCWCT